MRPCRARLTWGLVRTEVLYLGRTSAPPVGEQVEAYRAVFEAFAGRKVVIRTLDAGSDKPLPFATPPNEANPALGVRGIRIAEGAPGLLDRQLDAIAAAAERTGNAPWVMAPMVATAEEAKYFAAQVYSRGLTPGATPGRAQLQIIPSLEADSLPCAFGPREQRS